MMLSDLSRGDFPPNSLEKPGDDTLTLGSSVRC